MGGRGSNGSGGGSQNVYTVTTQSGDTITLNNPLVYSADKKAGLLQSQKDALDRFYGRHKGSKIEYGVLIDGKGNIILEKRGGRGTVGMPMSDYNRAFVQEHLHPRGKGEEAQIGGTFSKGDLQTFADTYIRTMRAAAYEGTYSITKASGFDPIKFIQFQKNMHEETQKKYKSQDAAVGKLLLNGSITYDEYEKARNMNFNNYLVDRHNALLAGQKAYGYTYGLERRN